MSTVDGAGVARDSSVDRGLGGGPGAGIITGKADVLDSDANAVNPGGVPIYRDGVLVGGVGVAGVAADVAEFTAFTGAATASFSPLPSIRCRLRAKYCLAE